LANIFISYRRGDAGWAGRLNDALEKKYAVYLDVRTQPGHYWQAELNSELEDCRVFLMVIGPEWVKDVNLARLADKDDWVRTEILSALARPQAVRVVPVLVGEASLPPADKLPPELRSIVELEWVTLGVTSWKSDVEQLMAKLEGWLAQPASARRPSAFFPRILPYLCDRIDQQDGVVKIVKDGTPLGVLACLVHGNRLGGHAGLLDRLVHRKVFETHFDALTSGVAVHRLEWTLAQAKLGDFVALLRRSLKRKMLGSVTASDEDLRERLKWPGQPTVLVLDVGWSDYRACGGDELLKGLLDGWFGIFREPPIVPGLPLLLWANFAYPSGTNGKQFESIPGALEELGLIQDRHIEEWIRLPEVQGYVRGRESKLLVVADNPGDANGGGLQMLEFVDAVEAILSA
jgi:hypothetical protein